MASETVPMVQSSTSAMRQPSTAAQSNQTVALAEESVGFKVNPNQTIVVSNTSTGMEYTVDPNDLIGSGGYACVFRARDKAGNVYAAKVSLKDRDYTHNRSYEDVVDKLVELTNELANGGFQDTHLMPIYAFEKDKRISVDTHGDRGWHEELAYIAVMPLCGRLDGKQINKDYLKKRVIPDVAGALHCLHKNDIVHRDVKPSNLFVYDDCVVLGDFNISSPVGGDAQGQKYGSTTTQRATPGYTPTTALIQPANDWYAFGYTIWTLYNGGRHPHQDYIEALDGTALALISSSKYRPVEFVPDCEEDEYLGRLIYGLTWYNPGERLGYEDIMDWVRNPKSITWKDPVKGDTGWWYKFEGTTYTDFEKLAGALAANWSKALGQLYNELLPKKLGSDGETDIANVLFTCANSKENQDLGLAQAIWYLSGDAHLAYWKGKDVSLANLMGNIDDPSRFNQLLTKDLLESGFLSWAAEQRGSSIEPTFIEKLKGIETAARKTGDANDGSFARLMFKSIFGEADIKNPMTLCQDADKLFEVCVKTPYRFYQTITSRESYEALLAVAYKFSDAASILKMLDIYPDASTDELTHGSNIRAFATNVLVFFEELVSNKTPVREFYIAYGPVAPWVWVADHAELYCKKTAGDSQVTQLQWNYDTITKGRCSSVKAMAAEGFEKNAHYCVQRIEDNLEKLPLRHYYGIASEKNVTVTGDDGFFCGWFYGEAVPRGFVRSLLKASESDMAGKTWDEVCLVKASEDDSHDKGFQKTLMDLQMRTREQSESRAGYVFGSLILLAVFVVCGLFTAPSLSEILVLIGLQEELCYAVAYGTFVSAIAYFAFASFYYIGRQRLATQYQALDKNLKRLDETYSADAKAYRDGESPFYLRLADPNSSQPVTSYRFSATVAQVDKNLGKSKGLHNSTHWGMWGASTVLPMMLVGGLTATAVWGMVENGTSYPNRFATGMVVAFILWLIALYFANSKSWCGPHFWLAMLLLPAAFGLAAVLAILIIGGILAIVAGIAAVAVMIAIFIAVLSS